jgi:hypothetical protein
MDTPMYRRTSSPEYDEVAVALVHALEFIGDGQSLVELTRLEASISETEMGKRLRGAAIEALPRLRERIERERAGEGLLRAAGQPGHVPGELLRSASDQSAKHDAQELGRAAGAFMPPGDESKHASVGRDTPC